MEDQRLVGADHSAPARTATPLVRTVSVVAQDPGMLARKGGPILMARVTIPAEDLAPGPTGYRLQVVDYDASTGRYAGAHQLPGLADKEPVAWREGRPSIVADPAFRAHNAYAIAMKTLARFEFALGRRVGWGFKHHQLKIAPTGMVDANAFYSPQDEGLVFGYFRGPDGYDVYTCLSHDVVAHETAHALLDGLRERYMLPSTEDQAAFHEGFADVVALLSVYAQREIVRVLLREIAEKDDAIPLDKVSVKGLRDTALFRLAEQMGDQAGGVRGEPLRESAHLEPDTGLLGTAEFQEPHRRGEVFVAAVLRAFLTVWADRIQRAKAPGQTRVSVMQVADEGADIADVLVTMWIRALDYLPPSDLEFGDALSAALTADFEVRPDDSRYRVREHTRRTFAAYGIRPAAKGTPAERGIWDPAPGGLNYDRVRADSMRSDRDEVFRFLWENRGPLELRPDVFTEVLTIQPCVRVGADGFTLRETVATYYQVARLTVDELRRNGVTVPEELAAEVRALRMAGAKDGFEDDEEPEFAVYGGATLIFDEYGHLKYCVHNDVFGKKQGQRLAYLWKIGALTVDGSGAHVAPMRLSALHRQRATDSGRARRGW